MVTQLWTPPRHLFQFEEQGTVKKAITGQSKLIHCSIHCILLSHLPHNLTIVMNSNRKTHEIRRSDFRLYHRDTEPVYTSHTFPNKTTKDNTRRDNAFKTFIKPVIPKAIDFSSPPLPTSIKVAHQYPGAVLWKTVQNSELDQLDTQSAIIWLKPCAFPRNVQPILQIITCWYVCDTFGAIIQQKARYSLGGDLMKPNIYYDPQNISAYAVNEPVICMVLALAVNRQYWIRHLDMKSAFTA